eukprot:CAMPEP_0201187074 /NCGR_PEP_ID=MMETSP0851-20130426/132781_1 /ASSEMBLY_ACC=CAM_ASM_000631 /TAXON_ID=183588 /ORGANISM="Pseudo-nitzschia fraudulenta, Strain WWA7" /LENGTH=328 /DNA_ID=CAMNT_0047472495 /DNA_START=37 /DNA_END=1023 /DNA_ORIENTATION=-
MKFIPRHRLHALIISLLSLVAVRAFISVHESSPCVKSSLAASRREFAAGFLGGVALSNPPAFAANDPPLSSSPLPNILVASQQSESSNLPAGLLESRLSSNVLEPPPFGMESTDIFYPSWFAGNWKISSETKDVQAPCGVGLFGGNATFNNAREDIGNVLKYDCRFLPTDFGGVIADREFNVKSIAKVSMGENSVVDVSVATPNKFSCLLAPKGAPSLLSVDLIVLNRRQERDESVNKFYCSEVVREIAKPVDETQQQRQQRRPSVLKEIETTSVYTFDPKRDEVRCTQRSAAFLLPSDQSEMAMRMWQLSRGRAIDVRFYDVVYTRT